MPLNPITLTDSADTFTDDSGADSILGLGGDDSISGFGYLDGGAGNDTVSIVYSSYASTLFGGTGDDSLSDAWGLGGLLLDGGDGNDTIYDGGYYTDTITGGAGNDYITARSAQIDAGAGTDTVFANGNDTVHGGGDNDSIAVNGFNEVHGDSGNDTIFLNSGSGLMDGGVGNDYIFGTPWGATTIQGGDGDDTASISVGTYEIYNNGSNFVVYDVSGSPYAILLQGVESVIVNGQAIVLDHTLYGNYIHGTSANENLTGGAGNDVLEDGGGRDTMDGGDGNDRLLGDGYSYLYGGNGNDTLLSAGSFYTILSGDAGDDSIQGSGTLLGGSGNDTLVGMTLYDSLDGGDGNDSLYAVAGGGTYNGGAGDDTISGRFDRAHIFGGDGNDLIIGGSGTIEGGDGNDTISQNFILTDGTSIIGGAGYDIVDFNGASSDYAVLDNTGVMTAWNTGGIGHGAGVAISGVEALRFTDTLIDLSITGIGTLLSATGSDETLMGTDYADVIFGNGGSDKIDGKDGNDTISGGAGADSISSGGGNDSVTGDDGNDTIDGGDGNDRLDGGIGADILTGGAGNDSISGGSDNDTVTGGDGNDNLDGGMGWDSLSGGVGNDTIYGDALGYYFGTDEHDTIDGGAGDDSIVALGIKDSILGGDGNDSISCHGGFIDGGSGNDTISDQGNNGDTATTIYGGSGDDQITESGSAWFLPNHKLIAFGGEGNDTLAGDVGADSLDGGDGADMLNGGYGDDTLVGGTGADTMYGFVGNDTYYVDNVGDVAAETPYAYASDPGGIDQVFSSVTFTLGDFIENLTLTGADATNGTGNGLDNVLIGNSGNNLLSGLDGNDSLDGGNGNDTLDGGTGNDTMTGSAGDDVYYVDSAQDVVNEATANNDPGGTDEVRSTATWTLGLGLENLTLQGSNAIDGTGNALGNLLTGNAGANALSGLGGNDTLLGQDGDDTLTGGPGNDSLDGGMGTDTAVFAGVRSGYVLTHDGSGGYVVTSSADGSADHLSGIERITFDDGTFDLGAIGNHAPALTGAQATLSDGSANHSYTVTKAQLLAGFTDSDGDALSVAGVTANHGTVTANSDGSFTLAPQAGYSGPVTFSYSVTDGYGAATAATETVNLLAGIHGTPGNDSLPGTSSADTIYGYGGNDRLDGQKGNDLLYGGDGNDTLQGGGGADTMFGGHGDDYYYVDNGADVVSEESTPGVDDGGYDKVAASISYTLTAHVEELDLLGSANINGTGNSSDDWIFDNAGNNVLSGLSGNDTLVSTAGGVDTLLGGNGDDVYWISSAATVITETNTTDWDAVWSSASYTLGNNLEELDLLGSGNVNGTGNSGDNFLYGNSGNNTLNGVAGDDTLCGNGGNDTLTGGAGGDNFVFAEAGAQNGVDTVQDFVHGTDQLWFTGSDYGFAAGHALAASEFTAGTTAVGSHAQFIWNAATHTLYWDDDGTGGHAAIAIATFGGGATVDASDFHFS